MEIKFKQELLCHISGVMEHSLKHKFTIVCDGYKHDGLVFYREIHTPKINEFEFGKAKAYFYFEGKDSKVYRGIKWLLKSLKSICKCSESCQFPPSKGRSYPSRNSKFSQTCT